MGFPISSLIANLFIEEFKVKAISSAPFHCLWLIYVDDTFVIQQAEQNHQFIQQINSLHPHIQFTREDPKENSSLPFPDTLVSLGPYNTLTKSVYRRPTHTDQYLYLDSNHYCLAKYNIYNTLAYRARVICTSQPTIKQEEDHIRQALLRCSFLPWTLNRLFIKINNRFSTNHTHLADTRH